MVEIGFVVIAFLLLFGALNYFNILPVSDVFPNQLGWLPQREVSTGTSPRQQSEAKLASQGVPLQGSEQNAAPSPEAFVYDTALTKTLLTQYIKDNLKPEFIPPIINIRQKLLVNNVLGESENQFGTWFNIENSTISATFRFNENNNTSNDYLIFIRPAGVEKATASLTNSLLSSYFTNPFIVSNCHTKEAGSYCENFQNLTDGKKGYGMVFISFQGNTKTIVFNCFIAKNGSAYATEDSCIRL